MLYLTDKVVNLRAWQLYLGNAIYTFLAGFVLLILARLLGFFGLDSSAVNNILGKVGQISGAKYHQGVQSQENAVQGQNQEHMVNYQRY